MFEDWFYDLCDICWDCGQFNDTTCEFHKALSDRIYGFDWDDFEP